MVPQEMAGTCTQSVPNPPRSEWQEFLDLKFLQSILDDFAKLTGISLVIVSADGKPATERTLPHNRLCLDLIQKTSFGKQACDECMASSCGSAARARTYKIYTCGHGLIEFVSPIIFEHNVLGYLLGGPVRVAADGLEKQHILDLDADTLRGMDEAVERGDVIALPNQWYSRHAAKLGIDPTEYSEAVDQIVALPKEKIEASARILHDIANSISMLLSNCMKERRSRAALEETVADAANPARPHDRLRQTVESIARNSLAELGADVVRVYCYRLAKLELATPPFTLFGRRRGQMVLPEDWLAKTVDCVTRSGDKIYWPDGMDGTGEAQRMSEALAAWAVAPMKAGGKVLGVLAVGYQHHPDFQDKSQLRQRIDFMANGSAILIENALLRHRMRRRFEIEDEVSSTPKSRSVAIKILDELREWFEYHKATLQLIRGDTRTLLSGRGFNYDEADRGLLRPISMDRLVGRIIAQREPLILSETKADPDWVPQSATENVNSWIGLPVIYGEKVIALFTLDHETPGFYGQALRERLVRFAKLAAPKIWRAGLWNRAERLIRDMEIVNKVAQKISAQVDTEDLLHTITRQISDELDCSHCTIFFPQLERGELLLVPRVTHGGRPQTMTRRFKPGDGLAGWVFQNGISVVSSDIRHDPRFAPARAVRSGPRSMLVAPIKVGDQTIGVISADQDALNHFSESDRLLVDALAQQVGTAIQRCEALTLLQNIANRIIALQDKGDILRELVSGAIRLTNTASGVIQLVVEDGRTMAESFQPPGFSHPPPRLDKEDSVTRTVIRTGEVMRIPDIRQHSLVNPALRSSYRSMVAVPLKIGDVVIGVMHLLDTDPHAFTETEVSLLMTLATQAAIAIQKARLVDGQIRIHKLLEDVVEHLVVQEQDQEGAMESIGRGIGELLGQEVSTSINLYDKQTDTFGACHAYGPLREIQVHPREHGTGRHVLATGQPLYLNDVLNPPSGCPTIRQESIDLGVRSFAAIPLERHGEVVGVLFVNSQKPLLFDDEIRRALEKFASQAGVAIEIARFHDERVYGAVIKAADLGYLASGIAHEFYNNLQNMKSILYNVEHAETEECRYSLTQELHSEIGRAVGTIDSFRSFRDRREGIGVVDLESLVHGLVSASATIAEEHGIDLRCAGCDVTEVKTDSSLVRSVLVNLLRNAMEAVEQVAAVKRVEIEVMSRGETGIEIAVRDSGPGIRSGELGKLFLPFYSTKGAGSTGVGLFWVQRIVNKMRGEIHVESKNSWGGATFRVVLPVESARRLM